MYVRKFEITVVILMKMMMMTEESPDMKSVRLLGDMRK